MRILIELPTWLGDTVMVTPALQMLEDQYPSALWSLMGSQVSIEALKNHPLVKHTFIDDTKEHRGRIKPIKILARTVGSHDLAFTFRGSFFGAFFLYLTKSKIRTGYKRFPRTMFLTHSYNQKKNRHQVETYADMINAYFQTSHMPGNLKLYYQPKVFANKTVGINPGATYGSAKRWYPKKFAEVAKILSDFFDILIFGGPTEKDMANEIEEHLQQWGIKNYKNLAGQTTITDLIEIIGGLSLFITNDSGPMHIAAAYRIPTVAIFGPTNHSHTDQWHNPRGVIVRTDIPCSPCMKHHCPLKHHRCMKEITPKMVIEAAHSLIGKYNI